jgi:hypothetical protein
MKKLIMMSVILASSFIYKAADAQVRVNLNVNLGTQPKWAQSNYEQVNYYYLPDLDMYYNVPNRTYTYLQGRRWVTVNAVPQHDFNRGYKVVVNDKNPWNNQVKYRNTYVNNRNVNRLDSRDKQYGYNKNNDAKYGDDRNDRDGNRSNDRTVRRGRG